MRMIRDITGRFKQRPHYTPQELDSESEHLVTEFLVNYRGAATFPISTDELTTLVEKHVDDLDLYSDLSRLGSDVEGVTIFSKDGKPSVRISNDLCKTKRENRLRTTLSHELGHVLFHNSLFQRSDERTLFDEEEWPVDPVQACREGNILNAGQLDWMEWQAGYLSGAMLMPATPLRALIAARFPNYVSGRLSISADLFDSMVEEVKKAFHVSAEAARIRLHRLQIVKDSGLSAGLF